MAQKIYTVEKILNDLNNGDPAGPWAPMPGLYTISVANIKGTEIEIDTKSLALKGFVNRKTAEIKTYVAKWLNIPETDTLL